jgi:hypothetical protein
MKLQGDRQAKSHMFLMGMENSTTITMIIWQKRILIFNSAIPIPGTHSKVHVQNYTRTLKQGIHL